MRRKSVRVMVVLSILAVTGLFGWINVRNYNQKSADLLKQAKVHQIPQSGQKVLIVAPHPDDETLALSGLMQKVKQNGAQVTVMFMTNGDSFSLGANIYNKKGYSGPLSMQNFGNIRQKEASSALSVININKTCFLGLPDQGLLKIRKSGETFSAPSTGWSKSQYENSCLPGLDYRYSGIIEALSKYLQDLNPDFVYMTGQEDLHSDHRESAIYINEALGAVQNKPKVYYYLVHLRRFPTPKGDKENTSLNPPLTLADFKIENIPLNPAEVSKKRQMLDSYQSQLVVPEVGGLMRSFLRTNEFVYTK